MKERKLTPKQQRFCDEYLIDLNATQAAIRAGYSSRTAASIGEENLRKPEIQKAVQKAMRERSKRAQLSQDKVLAEICRLAFSDLRKLFREDGSLRAIAEIDDDTAAAIAGIDIQTTKEGDQVIAIKKIKLWDKNSALEKLGKHLKLFTDQLEIRRVDVSKLTDEELVALAKGED